MTPHEKRDGTRIHEMTGADHSSSRRGKKQRSTQDEHLPERDGEVRHGAVIGNNGVGTPMAFMRIEP